MVEMRYSNQYVYVFEGRRPGEIAHQMPAYEVELAKGKWELVAPFNPDPTNPMLSMGRKWLAEAIDPATPVQMPLMATFDQLSARTQRAETALKGIAELREGDAKLEDAPAALDRAISLAEVTLEALK